MHVSVGAFGRATGLARTGRCRESDATGAQSRTRERQAPVGDTRSAKLPPKQMKLEWGTRHPTGLEHREKEMDCVSLPVYGSNIAEVNFRNTIIYGFLEYTGSTSIQDCNRVCANARNSNVCLQVWQGSSREYPGKIHISNCHLISGQLVQTLRLLRECTNVTKL